MELKKKNFFALQPTNSFPFLKFKIGPLTANDAVFFYLKAELKDVEGSHLDIK